MSRIWPVVLVAALAAACGPREYASTPTEQWIASVVMNECKSIGVDVVVDFGMEDSTVNGAWYGRPGERLQSCMGTLHNVVYVYPACNTDLDPQQLIAYARHECCHAYLGHVAGLGEEEMAQQEIDAEQCVVEQFGGER